MATHNGLESSRFWRVYYLIFYFIFKLNIWQRVFYFIFQCLFQLVFDWVFGMLYPMEQSLDILSLLWWEILVNFIKDLDIFWFIFYILIGFLSFHVFVRFLSFNIFIGFGKFYIRFSIISARIGLSLILIVNHLLLIRYTFSFVMKMGFNTYTRQFYFFVHIEVLRGVIGGSIHCKLRVIVHYWGSEPGLRLAFVIYGSWKKRASRTSKFVIDRSYVEIGAEFVNCDEWAVVAHIVLFHFKYISIQSNLNI